MDNEGEDVIVYLKCTDSQNSVTTSNVYSTDFTDSGSDKNNSSGKETYIIEYDHSDDSELGYELDEKLSIINLKDESPLGVSLKNNLTKVNCKLNGKVNQSTSDTFQACSTGQATFTQTSKTIIELAKYERYTNIPLAKKSLEIQTSLQSFIKNAVETLNYTNHIDEKKDTSFSDNNFKEGPHSYDDEENTSNNILSCSLDSDSSKLFDNDHDVPDGARSLANSQNIEQKSIDINERIETEKYFDYNNSLEESNLDNIVSSLMSNEYNNKKNYKANNTSDTSEVHKSLDSEMQDMFQNIYEKDNGDIDKPCVQDNFLLVNSLTPLTEESIIKTKSLKEITSNIVNIIDSKEMYKYVPTLNYAECRINLNDTESTKTEYLHLPSLKNNQPILYSPRLNFLFENNQKPQQCYMRDRWKVFRREMAAGESTLIAGESDTLNIIGEKIHLPPINISHNTKHKPGPDSLDMKRYSHIVKDFNFSKPQVTININEKIEELKMSNTFKPIQQFYKKISYTGSTTSRSVSPDSRLREFADRGCEALCMELLRRLKSNAWLDVCETLEELPQILENYWAVCAENRTADLIRQVSSHVDSPRTQVAKAACNALAIILKNTGYTKKPEFFEAVGVLLVKTGSYCQPVRRAANMALDVVVCGVELVHSVTAICVYGAGHKNPLVRCAAARLLVVSSALGGGGRELLRARPPSVAYARRHTLRALAALLEDKNTDTRKYAERLYTMLRPLSNFEAYYLTDVEVEVASRQMKRFDQMLLNGNKEVR
ncbi:hypothetical protein ACJJTC_003987 [Scirpophaga incertulas]